MSLSPEEILRLLKETGADEQSIRRQEEIVWREEVMRLLREIHAVVTVDPERVAASLGRAMFKRATTVADGSVGMRRGE